MSALQLATYAKVYSYALLCVTLRQMKEWAMLTLKQGVTQPFCISSQTILSFPRLFRVTTFFPEQLKTYHSYLLPRLFSKCVCPLFT